MNVLAHCPKCDAALPLSAADAPRLIRCGRCGTDVPLALTDDVRHDVRVDRCPVCSGSDFYLRKDFNPRVGLAVVAFGATVSAVLYWRGLDLVAYGILAAAALIDLIVYQRLREITVCYRCHAEFRGAYQRTPASFDLHTADALELEYQRRIGRQ